MQIVTRDDLKEYLWSRGIAFEDITELSGGTVNFVWRVVEKSGRIYIIKHAEPFVKDISSMGFPVERIDFEAHVLRQSAAIVAPFHDHSAPSNIPKVQSVPVLDYDAHQHVLILADAGERNLKSAYADPRLDIRACGRALGHWLAIFHREARTLNIGDNSIGKTIYGFSYRGLPDALRNLGLDGDLGDQIRATFEPLIRTDDHTVCHGDFWPGNILVGFPSGVASSPILSESPTSQSSSAAAAPVLSVVDWEFCRRGNGATDIGQFAAECWLLDRFRGGRGLLDAFLGAYVTEVGTFGFAFTRRLAVHFGTHLAYWPTRVRWGTDQETKEVVKIGVELLRRTLDEDWEWLRESSPIRLAIPP